MTQNSVVLVADSEAVHFYQSGKQIRILNWSHSEFLARVSEGDVVFVTSPSILLRSCGSNLFQTLKLISKECQQERKLRWYCPPEEHQRKGVGELLELVSELEDPGPEVGAELLSVAQAVQDFDRLMRKQHICRKFPTLDGFIPCSCDYFRAHTSSPITFMAMIRSIFDARLFMQAEPNVPPWESLATMRERVDAIVQLGLRDRQTLEEIRYALLSHTSPKTIKVREWYLRHTLVYSAARVAYSAGSTQKNFLDIVHGGEFDQDVQRLEEVVARVLRLIISEWASTLFGRQYFDRELLDGIKPVKQKKFKRLGG